MKPYFKIDREELVVELTRLNTNHLEGVSPKVAHVLAVRTLSYLNENGLLAGVSGFQGHPDTQNTAEALESGSNEASQPGLALHPQHPDGAIVFGRCYDCGRWSREVDLATISVRINGAPKPVPCFIHRADCHKYVNLLPSGYDRNPTINPLEGGLLFTYRIQPEEFNK